MKFDRNGSRIFLVGAQIVGNTYLNVSDSFVKYNKLETSGSGEARLYVGTRDKAIPFFGLDFINDSKCYKGIIHKSDLVYYMETAKSEYDEPQNYYRNQDSMINRFRLFSEQINRLDDVNYFWVKLHNGLDDLRQNRVYIDGVIDHTIDSFTQSNRAPIYDLLRSILLPIMSKLQVTKIRDLESTIEEEILWIRPYIHETSRLHPPAVIREEEERIESDQTKSSNLKFNLIASRIGQGKFRNEVLERFLNSCAISQIDQSEILEACHIKPWINSTDDEKLDKYNGILLNRNLHKLFDLGFITIDYDYNVICSQFVTDKVKREMKPISNEMKLILKKSEDYIDFHRKYLYVEYIVRPKRSLFDFM